MRKTPRFISQAAIWLDRQALPVVIVAGVVLGLSIGLPGFFALRSAVRDVVHPEGWDGYGGFRCMRIPPPHID